MVLSRNELYFNLKLDIQEVDDISKNTFILAKKGDYDSIDKITHKYEKIVLFFARNTHIKNFDIMDAIQEYNLVLLNCIKKYDLNQKVKFSTFLFSRLKYKKIDLFRDSFFDTNILSLDYVLNDKEFHNYIEDPISKSGFDKILNHSDYKFFNYLDNRSKGVLKFYYGLNDEKIDNFDKLTYLYDIKNPISEYYSKHLANESLKLKEIAQMYLVTRQMIHTIKKESLDILRGFYGKC